METPARIREIANALHAEQLVEPVTVRDFLEFFGAARRGSSKSEAIREVLEREGLETSPDFQGGWIDKTIKIRLAKSDHSAGTVPDNAVDDTSGCTSAEVGAGASETSDSFSAHGSSTNNEAAEQVSALAGAISIDPTFRISSLPAANKIPDALNSEDTIECAVTRMLQNDFSQMPIMSGPRDIKGMVSWKGLGSGLFFKPHINKVSQVKEEPHVVDENRTLFDVIPLVAEYGYVMVRFVDRTIKGPVTSSDLELHLQTLTQPFLLLREIELHVRRLLGEKITPEDISNIVDGGYSNAHVKSVTDLTFGQYVRLLQNPTLWSRIGIKIDRSIFVKMLDQVRSIRNDVMHFDPDPMTEVELGELKRAVRFMQSLQALMQVP